MNWAPGVMTSCPICLLEARLCKTDKLFARHLIGRSLSRQPGQACSSTHTLSKTMASRAVPSLVVEASERCRGPSRRALSAFSSASSVSDTLVRKIASE